MPATAPLCFEEHTCPDCEDGTGPCRDLFEHPICGLVACRTQTPDRN